jgi:hypothetical protein
MIRSSPSSKVRVSAAMYRATSIFRLLNMNEPDRNLMLSSIFGRCRKAHLVPEMTFYALNGYERVLASLVSSALGSPLVIAEE